jgi:hypothetical protein
MNCEELQTHLPDLLEKSLDIERAEAIENHLGTCSLCRAEVASLAECQQLVSALPLVEPPVNFTHRVMSEVREIANPPRLWERLFFPFRVKLPLQATAVILIAILAAYIYQHEQPQPESEVTVQPEISSKKREETDHAALPSTPGPIVAPEAKEAGETKARVRESRDLDPLKKPKLSSKREEPQTPITSNQLVAPQAFRSQEQIRSPATVSPAPLQEKPSIASESASPRQEQSLPPAQSKEASAPVPQAEKENVPKGSTALGKPSLEPEARRQGDSAISSASALRSGAVVGMGLPADRQLAIRLKELRRDDKAPADRLASGSAKAERRSLTSEEAKILEQAWERAVQTGQSQSVWITVALNQYDLLKKELTDLGNIEAESSTPERSDAAAESSGWLRVKVMLLLPLSSEKPASSQPASR